MTKKDLVKAIAKNGEITLKEAESMLDNVVGTIEECLVSGETINLIGFGKFSIATRAARDMTNPFNGEKISVPEKRYPKFKFSTTLKKLVAAHK